MHGSQQKYRLRDWQETVLFERPDGVKVTRVDAEFAGEGPYELKLRVEQVRDGSQGR